MYVFLASASLYRPGFRFLLATALATAFFGNPKSVNTFPLDLKMWVTPQCSEPHTRHFGGFINSVWVAGGPSTEPPAGVVLSPFAGQKIRIV
jgi:hypothetical protein